MRRKKREIADIAQFHQATPLVLSKLWENEPNSLEAQTFNYSKLSKKSAAHTQDLLLFMPIYNHASERAKILESFRAVRLILPNPLQVYVILRHA
ncbi:hypothetical protein Y032_0338g2941 [Ancylostoma ceylanicum]|nr:hypothetical protein Y032_0338g2941 [Ancylostoma ceylanicum]